MNLEDLRSVIRRGGVEPTPLELAETLWLATQMATPADRGPPDTGRDPGRTAGRSPRPSVPQPPPVRGAPVTVTPPPVPPAPIELHADRVPDGPSRRAYVQEVPKPIALDDRLAFQTALRPLLRRVPTPGLGTLDEEATATVAADHPVGAGWPAVMRPLHRRWLDAVVVVDQGDSMAIWQELAEDLVGVLRESGVFRQVDRYQLDDRTGTPSVTDRQGQPVRPLRLVDPANQRVILVVSDCVGRGWRSGAAGRVLHTWASRGPVAILQPLPERLWARTGGRTVAGSLSATRPCAPNRALKFASFGGRPQPSGTLVPVLEIAGDWLRRWTSLVAGGPPVTAAVTGVADEPAAVVPVQDRPAPTPTERVRDFRAAASEEAFQLARYVAMGDPMLDVIRHVHHAMFRPAQASHLAEVLLSGLLHVEDSRRGQYRFVQGVREVLLSTLPHSETLIAGQLLVRVSASVRKHRWREQARFMALAPGGGGEHLSTSSQPFAISEAGLDRIKLARRRLSPPAAAEPENPARASPQPPSNASPRARTIDPARLLDPRRRTTAFRGRDADLAALREWCSGSGTAARILTGPPGAGKSRLALELAVELRSAGWVIVGGNAAIPAGEQSVLVLIDRADLYPEHVRAAVQADAGRRVRVLAIARAAGEWWQDLRSSRPGGALDRVKPHELTTFGHSTDHPRYTREMVLDLGGMYFPGGDPAVLRAVRAVPDSPGPTGATPLDLLMFACEALLGPGVAEVADVHAASERQYAERSAAFNEIPFAAPERLDGFIAAAQLYGAATMIEVREIARLAGEPGTSPETIRRVAAWLRQLYPGSGANFLALFSRVLRERLVVPAARRDPRLVAALPAVSGSQSRRALDLLVPACRQWPDLTRTVWTAVVQRPALCAELLGRAAAGDGLTPELLDLARDTMAAPSSSVALLRAVADGVPQPSWLYAGQGPARADALTAAYERLAAASAPHRAALADAVRERGLLWEQNGEDDKALGAAEDELDLRRRLSSTHRDDSSVGALARALAEYAGRLNRAGRPLHGLAAVTEALQLLERLGTDPAAPEIGAAALVELARLLGQLDRGDEALDAARESTVRYRKLATHDPDRYSADLAEALLVEAARARALGRREEALRAGSEAVDRYETLPATPANRAALAYAGTTHGMDLGEMGSHGGGLAQLGRAVELYRQLVTDEPGQLPGLAAAQTGRALLLAELEQLEAADAALAEAAEIYRRLDAHASLLAGVMVLQAEVATAADRTDQAVAFLAAACELRERLHAADPLDGPLRDDLASSYQSLARLEADRGHEAAAHEAELRARLLRGDAG